MTQYKTLYVKLPNSQLKKLKQGIKNGTQLTLTFSLNLIGDSNDETNFPHKLSNTQVSVICKAFANGSAPNIKLSKTHLSKIGQSGEFLGRLLGLLLRTGFH